MNCIFSSIEAEYAADREFGKGKQKIIKKLTQFNPIDL